MRRPLLAITAIVTLFCIPLPASSLGPVPSDVVAQVSGPLRWSDPSGGFGYCGVVSGTITQSNPTGADVRSSHIHLEGSGSVIDLTVPFTPTPLTAPGEVVAYGPAVGAVSVPQCALLDQLVASVNVTACMSGDPRAVVFIQTAEMTFDMWGTSDSCMITYGTPIVTSPPQVETTPPGATIVPIPLTTVGSGAAMGCAGTVQVTFVGGASLALPGVRLGDAPCSVSNPPCESYVGTPGVVSCAGNPLACCTPLYAAEVGTTDHMCLRQSTFRVDVDGDGVWDVALPIAVLAQPPC